MLFFSAECEEALGLKLHNAVNAEDSSKRKVSERLTLYTNTSIKKPNMERTLI